MEYGSKGDLEEMIKIQKKNNELFEENRIIRWIA
jgi:hypothetical protein